MTTKFRADKTKNPGNIKKLVNDTWLGQWGADKQGHAIFKGNTAIGRDRSDVISSTSNRADPNHCYHPEIYHDPIVWGLRAMIRLLSTYYVKYGRVTVADIVAHWTDADHDEPGYIRFVEDHFTANLCSIDGKKTFLNLFSENRGVINSEHLLLLCEAMAKFEQGAAYPVKRSQVLEAMAIHQGLVE